MSSEDVFGKEAIKDDTDSIVSNCTWVLVDLTPEFKQIGYKWVFRRNITHMELFKTFKARMIAKCFKKENRKKNG